MKMRPNPQYPGSTKPRHKRRPKPRPGMITVQQVHCKDCKRSFELYPQAPALFCIWCRSDKIQKSVKTRRETPTERKQREAEMTARMMNAGFRLLEELFGFRTVPADYEPRPAPEVNNGNSYRSSNAGSALEAELMKEGYRKLAQKYHPDKGGDPEKMKELNRLKEKLGL